MSKSSLVILVKKLHGSQIEKSAGVITKLATTPLQIQTSIIIRTLFMTRW